MPRYVCDVTDNRGFHRDAFGEDLPGFDEARRQARGLLPYVAREERPDGDLHTVTCDVRDETGRVVDRGEITYRGRRNPA